MTRGAATVPGVDAGAGWRVEAERWRARAEELAARNVVLEAENASLLARPAEVDWQAQAELWRAGAQRLAEENLVLGGRVSDLQGQVEALAQKVATYARMLFGDSSEKSPPKRSGPGRGSSGAGAADAGGQRRGRGQQRGGRGHGRRDYSDLDTEEQVHDLPPGQRSCPVCGTEYEPFGEECSEQVDWRVRLVRVVHRRRCYRRACRCPVKGVITAPPPPKAIAKGRLSTGFLARLLMHKFALGLPAHRIVALLGADGLAMAEGTLAGVFAALSGLLAPLAAAISARNAASAHLHVDETRWSVFEAVLGKDSHRWWLWVFAGTDTVVFRIARSRSLAVLTEHLGLTVDQAGELVLPEGRSLLVSSDFYAVYQVLGSIDGVDPLWCWAHIRRRFVQARDSQPQLRIWAEAWLELIGALYAAHQALAVAEPESDAHRLAGAQFSAALNGIDAERQAQSQLDGLHPTAEKILATVNREWDGLARHKQHPQLPLDNNAAERALRTPVVGRKNFYGSGSVDSAELASRAWTILATAARAGYNPLAYLTSYLDACAANNGARPTGTGLARFLPWSADPSDQDAWRRPSAGHPATTASHTMADHTGGPEP